MRTYLVDSFTSTAFRGNPAGVCLMEKEISESLMQSIAFEIGFSETAFVGQPDDNSVRPIRFFSPQMEIPLCGHATLASAKVLIHGEGEKRTVFRNIRGVDLTVEQAGEELVMHFPAYEVESATAPDSLLASLGIREALHCAYNSETNSLMVEIEGDGTLRDLTPDFPALKRSHASINGVSVTARSSNPAYDFESRYFWPWSGTDEDPVTGGAHTFLTPYWAKKLDKTKMKAYQCSARGGELEVELLNATQISIKSDAVIVFEGRFVV